MYAISHGASTVSITAHWRLHRLSVLIFFPFFGLFCSSTTEMPIKLNAALHNTQYEYNTCTAPHIHYTDIRLNSIHTTIQAAPHRMGIGDIGSKIHAGTVTTIAVVSSSSSSSIWRILYHQIDRYHVLYALYTLFCIRTFRCYCCCCCCCFCYCHHILYIVFVVCRVEQ